MHSLGTLLASHKLWRARLNNSCFYNLLQRSPDESVWMKNGKSMLRLRVPSGLQSLRISYDFLSSSIECKRRALSKPYFLWFLLYLSPYGTEHWALHRKHACSCISHPPPLLSCIYFNCNSRCQPRQNFEYSYSPLNSPHIPHRFLIMITAGYRFSLLRLHDFQCSSFSRHQFRCIDRMSSWI
jgi:hypothetical protein